jgi:putative membrane protein
MRILAILAAIAGIILGTCVVGYYGFGAVTGALLTIGWGGFAIVCLYHLVLFGLLGLSWWVIVPKHPVTKPWIFVLSRAIRDAGSDVLPLSQIGGFVMGARAATLLGLAGAVAIATTVVDVTVEMLAQLGYTGLGLGLLLYARPGTKLAYGVAAAIVVTLAAAIAFIVAQRRALGLFEGFARRIAHRSLPAATARMQPVQDAIHACYERPAGLAQGSALHVVGWIANGIEAWIALALMGVPVSLAAVLTIESLLYAARSAAFFVPNAVGVQEGVYVMLGSLYGLPPETMLALSLLKRARDIIIGVPVLLLWQGLEGGRLWKRGARPASPAG